MLKESINFKECIIVNPEKDNVAVSKKDFKAGTAISWKKETVLLKCGIKKGQRFAIKNIPEGEPIVQYGYTFGISKGIESGDIIHPNKVRDIYTYLNYEIESSPPKTLYEKTYRTKTFKGFKREGGKIGTRNYYLIVPTSQCASETALQISRAANERYLEQGKYKNIDGIATIPNTEGCGCASNIQIDRFLLVLMNFVNHPNIGGTLIVDLGCEQTNYDVLNACIEKINISPSKTVDWVTIQQEGGTQKTIKKSLDIIENRLSKVNDIEREQCLVADLIVGTECGASDSFSGITANPLIGSAIDKIVSNKGSAILSEVPEMIGAEHILIQRMKDRNVISKFKKIMEWYSDIANKLGVDMGDNLVPENEAGGLINSCIKSIGAVAKGGTSAITDILEYGEKLTKRGLNLMQGPGNDIESVTGMVASGANIICFSTGKGTVTGNAIVPTIKISSTTELYEKMPDDIDFDAGSLLSENGNFLKNSLSDDLLGLIIKVASGERTKSELNRQSQFQVWTAGKLSL